jgi:hypothetical protein
MSVTPFEIARHIERKHAWWTVWYGRYTGHYWAMALWVPGPIGVLEEPTPQLLVDAIATFELISPKPTIAASHARYARSATRSRRQSLLDRAGDGTPDDGSSSRSKAWGWGRADQAEQVLQSARIRIPAKSIASKVLDHDVEGRCSSNAVEWS